MFQCVTRSLSYLFVDVGSTAIETDEVKHQNGSAHCRKPSHRHVKQRPLVVVVSARSEKSQEDGDLFIYMTQRQSERHT